MSFAGRKLHFIGIGGAGMSGLALVAARLGATVTGSDRAPSSYTERLAAAGIAVQIGHAADQVPDSAEVVVSTAIDEANPELVRARELGLTLLHRGGFLAELAAQKRCIAVAGTHGKTTTTAMIAHVFAASGESASFFVGGEVKIDGASTNAGWGDGEWVVVEADESDRSFLKLRPEIAVVTNVELDHHSTYAGKADLFVSFREFCGHADALVLWRGQPELTGLVAPGQRSLGFAIAGQSVGSNAANGAHNGDLVARDLRESEVPGGGVQFELVTEDSVLPVSLGVRGAHNVQNALAAIAALAAAGIAVEDAVSALANFAGVGRRFEFVGTTPGGALLYDDYAHHPTEVTAALRTARDVARGRRVVAIFQPHLFSRTASLQHEFGAALALADAVCVLDVYAARERAADFPGVNGYLIAVAAADSASGRPVYWTPGPELARRAASDLLRAGDVCVTIGAGDVNRVGDALLDAKADR